MIETILDKLRSIAKITGCDWELRVSHIFPKGSLNPCVTIAPEGWTMFRYLVEAPTIEEGVQQVVDKVYKEVVERSTIDSDDGWTSNKKNDDYLFLQWLKARCLGSDNVLPDIYSENFFNTISEAVLSD